MSVSHKGIVFSEERNKKISLSKIGNTFGRFNKGKVHTDETKKKFSDSHKGAKSNLWKGGLSSAPGYKSFHSRKRRALKANAPGVFTEQEWEELKAKYNYTCPCCGRAEPEIKLTPDHIVPISKGGSNFIEDIQPLCGSCNSRKGVKTVVYEMAYA